MGKNYRREIDEGAGFASLAALIEQSPIPAVELDPRGLVYANSAALSLFPDLPDRGEEHPFISGSRRIASGIREMEEDSVTGEIELNGSPYRLHVSLVPETGGLRAYATELAESRGLLRNVVENATDAIFLHDLKGRIVEVNRGACKSLGYEREDLLSRKIQEIEALDSEDLFSLWQGMAPDKPVTVESLHRRKDGTSFPVEARLVLSEESGTPLVLAMVRDVTEREEARRLLAES